MKKMLIKQQMIKFRHLMKLIFMFQAHNNNVISKAALAQRARRERERNDKASSSYQLGQRLRREGERSRELIPPSTTNTPPAQKGVMFTHLPSQSTSLASQRNW